MVWVLTFLLFVLATTSSSPLAARRYTFKFPKYLLATPSLQTQSQRKERKKTTTTTTTTNKKKKKKKEKERNTRRKKS